MPTTIALQRTVGNAAVQRMLQRNGFRQSTRNAMPVSGGDHRRHIISNHTMKAALQQWWDVKGASTAGNNTRLNSFGDVKRLLEEMNNNTSNLWPGNGAANTAIGMLAHNMSGPIAEIADKRLAGQEAYDVVAKYSGFQQRVQQELAAPILETVKNEKNPREVVRYLGEVQKNADLDFPSDNPQSVMTWQDLRGRFERLEKNPSGFTEAHVLNLYRDFMNMPAPT